MKRIGLIDVDSKIPNLALMKIMIETRMHNLEERNTGRRISLMDMAQVFGELYALGHSHAILNLINPRGGTHTRTNND